MQAFSVNRNDLNRKYAGFISEKFDLSSLDYLNGKYDQLMATETSAIGRLRVEGNEEMIADLSQQVGSNINFIASDIFTIHGSVATMMKLTGSDLVFYVEGKGRLFPNPAVIFR